MKSDYIDLVVAAEPGHNAEVFALPAWTHAKAGDLIMVENETLRVVKATQTVLKNGQDHRFSIAMNGGKIHNAIKLFHGEELEWEEDTPDESSDE